MKKMSLRVRVTLILVGVLAAALLIGGAAIFALHRTNNLPIPVPFRADEMIYTSTEEVALETDAAYTYSLCVGSDFTANENISLSGSTESAALFDLDARRVLFSRNMYGKIYPASITKIITAILTIKYGEMDKLVTINWRDLELESGSQVVGFRIGDKVTVRDLLHGVLIHSGNDAAMALARVIGGTEEHFVEMMNEELREIGATGSHFTNPTGLHDLDHYTTVYDIYLMLNEAVKYEDFKNIMQIKVYELSYTDANGNPKSVTLDSTDWYLTGTTRPPKDVTVLGGKTGTTSAAGHCLAILSQNAFGEPFISVVVGAQTSEMLYEDMNSLLGEINA